MLAHRFSLASVRLWSYSESFWWNQDYWTSEWQICEVFACSLGCFAATFDGNWQCATKDYVWKQRSIQMASRWWWFVSVTSGFHCIDFRFWFVSTDDQQKRWPTKMGLALKLCEWWELKNIIRRISVDYPKLSATVPCFIDKDHFHPDIASHCLECMPIPVEGCDEFHQRAWLLGIWHVGLSSYHLVDMLF